jgi:hypothetical protein
MPDFCYQFTDPDGEVYKSPTAAARAAALRLSKETGLDAALWLQEAAPRAAPRTVRATRRKNPSGGPAECEVRRVGDASWRRFASQSDAARAIEELRQDDISNLINNPSKVPARIRGRFEARWATKCATKRRCATKRPAADASSAPKRAKVQLDDDDDAAPSGPASELDEAPQQDVAALPAPAPQPISAVAAPPVGAVAAADARVPFGGALQELGVDVELDAALAAPPLDKALAAPAWPTPPPALALDASAQLFGLDLDARSRQAAAAPAPVVAAPALVSPVAPTASKKRPRDESPTSVAPSCVEATSEQETTNCSTQVDALAVETPPKRARCAELVAADPLASSAVCMAAVGTAGAMAFWPQIVAAELDDAQKLGRDGADAALAGFGLSPEQRTNIRAGLAGFL